MIVTTIDKLDSYSEVPYAKEIMNFIEDFKKTEMAPGRYDIIGDDLFAAVSRYDTEPVKDRKFESHKKYIDLQILLEGQEEIHWADVRTLNCVEESFSKGGDIAFYEGSEKGIVILADDDCAVLFENDAHKPNVMHKTAQSVLKVVFKIKK